MSNSDEAEDLTNNSPDGPRLGDNSNRPENGEVIDSVGRSLSEETNTENVTTNKRKSLEDRDLKKKAVENEKREPNQICPICRTELGSQALAATECGHVYCLSCIENSLKFNKKCPTCRYFLRGKSAYRPLYLGLG